MIFSRPTHCTCAVWNEHESPQTPVETCLRGRSFGVVDSSLGLRVQPHSGLFHPVGDHVLVVEHKSTTTIYYVVHLASASLFLVH